MLGLERIQKYPLPAGADTGRKISAYCVPAVRVVGDPKVAVYKTLAPLAKVEPGIVVLARSAPVGRPALVFRTDSVRFGGVAPQPLQKSWTSALARVPLTAGIKLWPVQLGVPKPVPVVVPAVFAWSTAGAFERVTSPGLVLISRLLVKTPSWNSALVVSVGHALATAAVRAKFCVVVPPSVTAIVGAEAEL